MTAAFVVIAALLLVAIAVQVRYALVFLRSDAEVTLATKVVWGFNIAILVGVLVVLAVYMLGGV